MNLKILWDPKFPWRRIWGP